VPKESAHTSLSTDNEVVVDIAGSAATESEPALARSGDEPFTRFRRRFERSRGRVEEHHFADSIDDEDDLRLQVMLLREENARLKAGRHKPVDTGSMIERMRTLAAHDGDRERLDESWSVLAECLALREGLDQACVEVQAAISSVRERLGALGLSVERIAADGATLTPDLTPDLTLERDDDRTQLSA
jgi:hypothetical protein